jgi:K+-transporting ATPase ATPase C chain
MKETLIAVRATLFTFVVTGIAYPLAITAIALIAPARANGSLVKDEAGRVVGSELIAQAFTKPGYLQPRPSAIGYDGAGSGGSNFGPSSKALRERADKEAARLRQENPGNDIPPELLTTSASGLDPHLSPEAALYQAARIAKARNVSEDRVRKVVENYVEGRDLGVLGEPRVNVLLVNLALDRQFGRL